MEQTRHRLRTELKKMSQQDIRDGFDDVIEQFLQISGGKFVRSEFNLRAA
jgi:hypothetical protein